MGLANKLKSTLFFLKKRVLGFFNKLKELRIFSKRKPVTPLQRQNGLDKKLVFSLRRTKIPSIKQLKFLGKILSRGELRLIKILTLVILICLILIGVNFYLKNSELLPVQGGEYTEGLIGSPQYINPLLSQANDVDMNISRLIFSGLMKHNEKQELIMDIASGYEVSKDEKIYTFYLRKDIKWHDGEPLNADDVVFTVKSIQSLEFKSPLLVSFKGIEIKKIDDYTIRFILLEPFSPFLGILTFGILPEHLWANIPPINARLAEYNFKPIGTGPFQFASLIKDKFGEIKSYTLLRNDDYYGKKPYLKKFTLKFYPNFDEATSALENKNVQGISFLPKELKKKLSQVKKLNFHLLRLSQYTAIFFNQKNNKLLKEKNVRIALALGLDKEKILNEALHQEGEIIHGPILPDFIGYNPEIKKYEFNPEEANKILDEAGWKKITPQDFQKILKEGKKKLEEIKENLEIKLKKKEEEEKGKSEEIIETKEKKKEEKDDSEPEETIETIQEKISEIEKELNTLKRHAKEIEEQEFYRQKENNILSLTLTTVDRSENSKAAQITKESWQKIGVKIDLELIEPAKIQKETIAPRSYDALLYGEIIGYDPDPYPFWHSSQSEDPGLNLAVFSNKEADKVLEEARATSQIESRRAKYVHFQNILVQELPAIFLYNPLYTYPVDKKIQGISIERITTPSDRFINIENWFTKTKRRWK